jgi:hypothetical protein
MFFLRRFRVPENVSSTSEQYQRAACGSLIDRYNRPAEVKLSGFSGFIEGSSGESFSQGIYMVAPFALRSMNKMITQISE